MRTDILQRLRIDPGQRTLGQLLQDREAAALEIERLRAEINRREAPARRNRRTTGVVWAESNVISTVHASIFAIPLAGTGPIR
jgi:hypothetical protein